MYATRWSVRSRTLPPLLMLVPRLISPLASRLIGTHARTMSDTSNRSNSGGGGGKSKQRNTVNNWVEQGRGRRPDSWARLDTAERRRAAYSRRSKTLIKSAKRLTVNTDCDLLLVMRAPDVRTSRATVQVITGGMLADEEHALMRHVRRILNVGHEEGKGEQEQPQEEASSSESSSNDHGADAEEHTFAEDSFLSTPAMLPDAAVSSKKNKKKAGRRRKRLREEDAGEGEKETSSADDSLAEELARDFGKHAADTGEAPRKCARKDKKTR